jgi:hypothetical protein
LLYDGRSTSDTFLGTYSGFLTNLSPITTTGSFLTLRWVGVLAVCKCGSPPFRYAHLQDVIVLD